MASPKYRLSVPEWIPSRTTAAVAGVGGFVAFSVMLIGKLWPGAWDNEAERVLWESGLMFLVTYLPTILSRFVRDSQIQYPEDDSKKNSVAD